mmetsp:Transcript_53205/g.146961  ORF Transcript_53205/g.146961 Transcript_53205/m.146961 type:complete len:322 (+) Transcript_53205:2398-3363(+)
MGRRAAAHRDPPSVRAAGLPALRAVARRQRPLRRGARSLQGRRPALQGARAPPHPHAQRGPGAPVRGGGQVPVAPRQGDPRLRGRAAVARRPRRILPRAPHVRPILRLPVDPQVHRRAVHRAHARHGLQHLALPPLVASKGRGALRPLQGLLHLRHGQAGQDARRQQACPVRSREAFALQGTLGVAGAGRRLRALHPLARLHRRRRALALVLPLPDHQPARQPGGRSVHRVRPPDDALLLQLRAAPARPLHPRARHLAAGGGRPAAPRPAAAQAAWPRGALQPVVLGRARRADALAAGRGGVDARADARHRRPLHQGHARL